MSSLRQPLRSLLWNPGFTITAVLTLSLGIGLSTAMFSFIDALLLKPVGGIVEQDRLVLLGEEKPGAGDPTGTFSPSVTPPVFFGWREHNTVFAHVGASTLYTADVFYNGADGSEVLKSRGASAGFFEAVGVAPRYGRFFRVEEERAGSERVVILTHRLWRSRFASDPRVVGSRLRLNGESHTVVGVLAANRLLDTGPADLWLPLAMDPEDISPRNFFLVVHGRLKPGVTIANAETDLNRIEAGLKDQGQVADPNAVVRVRPYRDHLVGRDMRRATLLLGGAVALILFIACTNLAHLLVARHVRTRKDIAIRVALGASRLQVVEQFVLESLALSIAGGLGGVFVAHGLMRGLLLLMPPGVFAYDVSVGIDVRVLLFAGVLSVLTGVVFGLLPALTFARADLRSSGLNLWAASSGSSSPVARQMLLVAVVALTFTLVSGSALLLGSLNRLLSIDPGFRATHTVAMQVRLDRTRYASVASALVYQDLMLERVRALPGVASAAVSNILPLGSASSARTISRRWACPC